MAIKTYKPYTHSRRNMTGSDFAEITKKSPEKSLTVRVKNTAGRNSYGKITVRHQGGGNKIKYRVIDFKRDKVDIPAKVNAIEYDPNRSAFIALLFYADGEKPTENVTVPGLYGMTYDEAIAALAEKGLFLETTGVLPTSDSIVVLLQSHAAGSEAKYGSVISAAMIDKSKTGQY